MGIFHLDRTDILLVQPHQRLNNPSLPCLDRNLREMLLQSLQKSRCDPPDQVGAPLVSIPPGMPVVHNLLWIVSGLRVASDLVKVADAATG